MAAVRDMASIAGKWREVSGRSGDQFKKGVLAPKKSWVDGAANGAENYKTGVIQAANDGRFAKGVRKAGNETWSKAAAEKGPDRYSTGVAFAGGKYEEKFSPYLATIAATTLPPRYPRGDSRNVARVQAIASALNAKRKASLG